MYEENVKTFTFVITYELWFFKYLNGSCVLFLIFYYL